MCVRRAPLQLLGAAMVALLSAGCAAARFVPPTDPGTPLPAFEQIAASLTTACAGARTFTAELQLAGKAGPDRLRGRVIAGFARPDAMRLEGVAPLGPPAFILVSQGGAATLVLPRENAVLRGQMPEQVLEALTGVALQPADLLAALTGCVTSNVRATGGIQHADGTASVSMQDGSTLFLRRDGNTWKLRAARRREWWIEYPNWEGTFPPSVRLRSDGRVAVDLTAAVSQVEANVDLDAAAFTVMIPPNSTTISLADLRQNGPLRGQP